MKNKEDNKAEISSMPIIDQPENVTEMINKYGTYEIQPTADTLNDYPAISQGLAKKDKNSRNIF